MRFISKILLIIISIRKRFFKGTNKTPIVERSHGKLNVVQISFSNPIEENTFIVWDRTKECIIIDAGNISMGENRAIEELIEQRGLKPVLVVATHGHFDHLLGVEFLRKRYDVKFAMCSKDIYLLEEALSDSRLLGFTLSEFPDSIDYILDYVGCVSFGESVLHILPTPGHSPGHISLYDEFEGVLFVGDTLFKGSIGRTNYKGGNRSQLMESIAKQILPLGNHVTIYSGHGDSTTISQERVCNSAIVRMLNGDV